MSRPLVQLTHHEATRMLPMEARSEEALPSGAGWRFEPKWDGFRCLASKTPRGVTMTSKSGKSLARYFPELVAAMEGLRATGFTLDGELLIEQAGPTSFEGLQARLHPAESRIRRLAAETPATFMAFDILALKGRPIVDRPLAERHALLEAFLAGITDNHFQLSPGTLHRRTAQAWLAGGRYEGVVAKRLSDVYQPGERAMVKIKRRRTADCVVGGYRREADSGLVGSMLLGLYNDQGLLDHVGFTSAFAAFDRRMLTKTLDNLAGGEGFSGAAPGRPSRWAGERSSAFTAVDPKLVVEVSFDHVSGGRFRHGTRLLRFRPDKRPSQCRMVQIQ